MKPPIHPADLGRGRPTPAQRAMIDFPRASENAGQNADPEADPKATALAAYRSLLRGAVIPDELIASLSAADLDAAREAF